MGLYKSQEQCATLLSLTFPIREGSWLRPGHPYMQLGSQYRVLHQNGPLFSSQGTECPERVKQ